MPLIQPSEILPIELTEIYSILVYRFKVIALSLYKFFFIVLAETSRPIETREKFLVQIVTV